MRDAGRAYTRPRRVSGAFEHASMRMGFLSIKQLVYLERYGRMYIPEESILGDPVRPSRPRRARPCRRVTVGFACQANVSVS